MVVGGAATIITLLGLSWVRELVGGVLEVFGVELGSDAARTITIVVATLFMYGLDFSINTGMFSSVLLLLLVLC